MVVRSRSWVYPRVQETTRQRLSVIFPALQIHTVMREMEAYSCSLYRVCCSDQVALKMLNGTCTREHTGASVGAAAASLYDPSGASHLHVRLLTS